MRPWDSLRFKGCGLAVAVLMAVGLAGCQEILGSAAYKVTYWPKPGAGADTLRAEDVEEHLNRMAGDGWRLVGSYAGNTPYPVMIFERTNP